MKRLAGVLFLAALGVTAEGCGFGDGSPEWAKSVGSAFGASTTNTSGRVDFVNNVKPQLAACAGCHSTMTTNYTLSSGQSDDTADYNATAAQLDTANPTMSNLLIYASDDGVGHSGGALWASGSAEYDLILQWIADGTEFEVVGAPPPPPPPANPVWADVKPHLQGCAVAGCHATSTDYRLTAGLTNDTADYAATLNYVNLGTPAQSELLLRATQTQGHPVLVFAVDSAPYVALRDWIADGANFQ